jgi:hypothetical protein
MSDDSVEASPQEDLALGRAETSEEERKREEERVRDQALAQQTSLEVTALTAVQNMQNILQDLPKMTNLRSLKLQNCEIDDDLAVRLADAIKNCKRITFFDVQYNRIRERGFAALIPHMNLLEIGLIYFQGKVKVSKTCVNNRMSVSNVRELLKLPPPADPNSSEFATIRLGGQIFPKVGVLSLQTLCLSEMNLGDEGAKTVASSFSNTVSLNTLFFYENAVCAEGASAIARQLPNAPALKNIHLSGNFIPPEYAEKFEMMNALRETTGLSRVKVGLAGQRVPNNDEEANEIARKIPSMANGTEIDFYIEGKKFTPYGQGLIEAANESRKIFDLEKLKISF